MKTAVRFIKVSFLCCMVLFLKNLFAQYFWNGSSTVTTTTTGKISLASSSTVKWSIYNDAGSFAQDHLLIGPGDGSSPKLILPPDGGMELRSNTHTVFNIATLGIGVNPYVRFSSNGNLKWSFYKIIPLTIFISRLLMADQPT